MTIRLTPQNIARGAPWNSTRVVVETNRACTVPAAAVFIGDESVSLAAYDPGRSDHIAPPALDRLVVPGHPVELSIAWAGGAGDTPRVIASLHLGDTVASLGHLLYWERGPISVSAPWREEDQPHTGTTALTTPRPPSRNGMLSPAN